MFYREKRKEENPFLLLLLLYSILFLLNVKKNEMIKKVVDRSTGFTRSID